MKYIIPMSGQGNRFKAAGYSTLKPLIVVEGKPIIAHVLDMLPDTAETIFICNKEHVDSTPVVDTLLSLRPNSLIIAIPPHTQGPVYAVSQVFDHITDDEEVFVSYCDFTQRWNYDHFKNALKTSEVPIAGAVTAYTGFHPHLLHRNVYAGILTDEHNMMQEIKEKHCFTENPEDSYHSSGLYYFASGSILKHYARMLLASQETLRGEYYMSMVYPHMLADKLPIYVPPVQTFMQWGTPEDLEEYEAWSALIHNSLQKSKSPTEIPPSRKPHISIPHHPESDAYVRSHDYWLSHFNTTV